MTQAVLYYIHDPMCSWCWGYRPVWDKLKTSLPQDIEVVNVLGGLAPDNDQPMSAEMKQTIQGHWRNIQAMLGTEFNFDFWTNCQPRRDTYKASRAVVVATGQGLEDEMITAIQHAYYLRAMNPSEPDTLAQLAGEIGMGMNAFRSALMSEETDNAFRRQLELARRFGVRSFPSLIIKDDNRISPVLLDYHDHRPSLQQLNSALAKTR